MKAGVGNACIVEGEATVYALSVVNALGNIVLPDGYILAGNRNGTGGFRTFDGLTRFVTQRSNTIISTVGTNMKLGPRANIARVARMAAHGQIRATYPSGTSLDGDAVFAFSTEEIDETLNAEGRQFAQGDWFNFRTDLIGHMAARAVQNSIVEACANVATQTVDFEAAFGGVIPSVHDYRLESSQ